MMGKFSVALTLAISLTAGTASASVSADIAYEQVAQKLELIRNQMELTIENKGSLRSDLTRQQREIDVFGVYARIPTERADLVSDKELLASIRRDLEKSTDGWQLRALKFTSPWRKAPRQVPATIAFDEDYRIPESQLVDRRELELVVAFKKQAPTADQWLDEQQEKVLRLLRPVSLKKEGRLLRARLLIFRYREIEYPRMLAPDLGRYPVPSSPRSDSQKAAVRRAERYRQEIVRLWPKVQPHLDDVRAFALNDSRMNFFLKHASRDNLHHH